MMNSKLNIYCKEWLDVIFVGRNKMYGAYELRNLSNRATNIGLVIVVLFALLLIAGSYAYNKYFKQVLPVTTATIVDVTLADLDDMQKEVEKKEVEKKEEVKEETILMQKKNRSSLRKIFRSLI